MANKGKFIDRNPNMRTAGTILEPDGSVGDSLKIYTKEEAAANIMTLKCKREVQDAKKNSSQGVSPFLPDEKVKDLLSPESKKSRFVAFREKFSEDMFFKKAELGQVFPLATKPETYTNESFTYGIKRPHSEAVYELILPKKTADQVNRDYTNWHDKYVISHKHYFPSERIRRPYSDIFKPKATFGKQTAADTTGRMMRQCLERREHLVVINKSQKSFIDRTTGPLGTSINSANIGAEDYSNFDKSSHPEKCDVRALLENIEPCLQKTTLMDAIAHVNKLRRHLFNRIDFHMHDLKTALQQYDEASKGYLTFDAIFKALRSLVIRADESKIRLAASHYKIIENEDLPNERINLDLFWQMLHIQYPLPRTGNISAVPENFYNKSTTYRTLCSDRSKPLECHTSLESSAHNKRPSDDDRTRAVDLISPDIPMHFGLGPSDFEALRPKEELRKIFKRVLTNNFDAVWGVACAKLKGDDGDCKMSVNNLREAMNGI